MTMMKKGRVVMFSACKNFGFWAISRALEILLASIIISLFVYSSEGHGHYNAYEDPWTYLDSFGASMSVVMVFTIFSGYIFTSLFVTMILKFDSLAHQNAMMVKLFGFHAALFLCIGLLSIIVMRYSRIDDFWAYGFYGICLLSGLISVVLTQKLSQRFWRFVLT